MMYVHRLVTDAGFIEEFWRRYREMSAADGSVTQQQVYESMEEEYMSVFGEYKYKSFDAFRKRRDKAR